jgi:molybdopterin biosynthesis enzyme
MPQLSSDLEAFGEPMCSVDEAANHIAGTLVPVADVETVPLAQADARVIAYDLIASMALPPFTNSAVDGYAVRFADIVTATGARLTVADRVMAGGNAKGTVPPGRAVRIFTGAPMPDGSDTVFMQEDVRVDAGGRVHFPTGLRHGANVRPIGEDIPAGSVVLPRGRRLRPQRLCWRSSGFWVPWLFVSQDGVEDGEEFAGRGDDDEHFGFACVNEARAQRPKDEPASPPLPRPQSYQTRKPSYKDVAVCAALGLTELEVRRSVRVAVFSTGEDCVAWVGARALAAV